MPNWEAIRKEWEETDIKLSDLADKHEVKLGTLKSRKSREKWLRDATKKVATKHKKDATKKKNANPKKKQRYPNGHPGNKNPVKKFTERNQAARKHGLFSRYMPKETLEIIGQMEDFTPADIIWSQIQIQYAAIIRAQQIMYVEDQDDLTKVLKRQKSSDTGWEEEYELQFAWDKHAAFLNAQSKAFTELRASIRQFEEMADLDDERRLKLEQMQLNINKTKAEIENLNDPEDDKPIEILIKRKE